MTYTVYVYPIDEKPSIVEKFYKKLQKPARQKIVRQLRYLEEYGLISEVIGLKKLQGYDFWEVRILGKTNIRIFVWGFKKDIYILHLFEKKKQSTDQKELYIARDRLKIIMKMISNQGD